jgi:hypothetical protein
LAAVRTLWSAQEAARAYREIIPTADIVFAGLEEAAIAVASPGAELYPEEAERLEAALGPRAG